MTPVTRSKKTSASPNPSDSEDESKIRTIIPSATQQPHIQPSFIPHHQRMYQDGGYFGGQPMTYPAGIHPNYHHIPGSIPMATDSSRIQLLENRFQNFEISMNQIQHSMHTIQSTVSQSIDKLTSHLETMQISSTIQHQTALRKTQDAIEKTQNDMDSLNTSMLQFQKRVLNDVDEFVTSFNTEHTKNMNVFIDTIKNISKYQINDDMVNTFTTPTVVDVSTTLVQNSDKESKGIPVEVVTPDGMKHSDDSSISILASVIHNQNALFERMANQHAETMKILVENRLSHVSSSTDIKKNPWPTFSGDKSKFDAWYDTIIINISVAPWNKLYDDAAMGPKNRDDLSEDVWSLDQQLFSNIMNTLKDSASTSYSKRSDLGSSGLRLIRDMYLSYHPYPGIHRFTELENIYSSHKMKQKQDELITDFYVRFKSVIYEMNMIDRGCISNWNAKSRFIQVLGSKFEAVRQAYAVGNLPSKWIDGSWPEILDLVRGVDASILSNEKNMKDETNITFDYKTHIQTVVRILGEMTDFDRPTAAFTALQNKHPNKCIYHLTTDHTTKLCRNCRKYLKNVDSSNSGLVRQSDGQHHGGRTQTDGQSQGGRTIPSVTGRHVDADSNSTSTPVGNYIQPTCRRTIEFFKRKDEDNIPIILDSGANRHMFGDTRFFTNLYEVPGNLSVKLGDGSSIQVNQIGDVKFKLHDFVVQLHDVLYIPELSASLFSLLLHEGYQDCSYHGESNEICLTFPTFEHVTSIGTEMFIEAFPVSYSDLKIDFDDMDCPICPIHRQRHSYTIPISSKRRNHIKHKENNLNIEPLNNQTSSWNTRRVTSSRKRRLSTMNSNEYITPTPIPILDHPNNEDDVQSNEEFFDCIEDDKMIEGFRSTEDSISQFLLRPENIHILDHLNISVPDEKRPESTPITSNRQTGHIPSLRCVDKASSTLPKSMNFTVDYLRASLGFRNIDQLLAHPELYVNNYTVDATPCDPFLDPGDTVNINKGRRNTVPVPRPSSFGDVIHVDIVFGPGEIAIDSVRYGLIFVDRYSRMVYILPLQNLTTDIIKQYNSFMSTIGKPPKRIIADFDMKLIGGDAKQFLESHRVHVNAAPPNHQNQNGLAERHWQTIVAMARAWLKTHNLPSIFWFFAVQHAALVCNYFPKKIEDGKFTTPLELAHRVKPDLRNLFPLFSLAYVKKDRDGDKFREKFSSKSEPMIVVGRCPISDGLLFYNPVTKSTISSVDYRLDSTACSGAEFGYAYERGVYIHRLMESTKYLDSIFKPDSEVLIHTHSPPANGTVISISSSSHPTTYTVQMKDGSIAEFDESILSSNDVDHNTPLSLSTSLPHWIKHDAKATLYLESMSNPKHGKLRFKDDTWFFHPGISESNEAIKLDDLPSNISHLMETAQLFMGHKKFPKVFAARNQSSLRRIVVRHVSAHGLSSLIPPASLKDIKKLNDTDQQIHLDAYNEEYDGLSNICWDVISETEFQQLQKHCRRTLPSMAICTIKYDEFGKAKRVKWRIVVLGNLDSHTWTKSDTYAPVMSQLEFRLLLSLAVSRRRVLKNGDVKQAFIQSELPANEIYVIKPPAGCPRSEPNTYWLLKRALYGLKKSPKHWYNKISKILLDFGLKACPTSPCIFYGTLLDNQPPIYIGLYVDDFIYFSDSDKVEQQFETSLKTALDNKIDFFGQASHFLGSELAWQHSSNGELSVTVTQQSFIENFASSLKLDETSYRSVHSPYRSGLTIDSIPHIEMTTEERDILRLKYQSIVGSLNWIAHTSRPDISTVVSLLAQRQANPSPGHMDAAIHASKYLLNTKSLGLYFTSARQQELETFLQFQLGNKVTSLADANWGPQDASIPNMKKTLPELPLAVSRSMSAFFVYLFGPLHWMSKRQDVTATSSAEAEIYATNEATKFLLQLVQLMEFLDIKSYFMPNTNIIYNDNKACVDWSKSTTTKGLRHIQMRENHVRENVISGFIEVHHIDGKLNLADLFTKEHKDLLHFQLLRDYILGKRPIFYSDTYENSMNPTGKLTKTP